MSNQINQGGVGGNQILVFKKMKLEDIGKDPIAAIQNFSGLYNQFGQTVFNLLSGSLQFNTNIQGQIFSTTITTPDNYSSTGANSNFTTFNINAGYTPVNTVIVGKCALANGQNAAQTLPVWASWYEGTPGLVTVQYVTGLQAGTKYNLTFQLT